MKHVLIVLFSCLVLGACEFVASEDATRVSGTYVRTYATELYIIQDTVSFYPVTEEHEQHFTITRKSATNYHSPDDETFNQHTSDIATGTYDPDKQILSTADPGIVYVFDIENKTVTLSGIVYNKID